MPFQGRRPKPLESEAALYDYAISALARRMRTTAEMGRLLKGRVAPGPGGEAMIEAVLVRLREREYLSDDRYAAVYSASRLSQAKLGARRVAMDLQRKGVPQEVIRSQVDAAFEGVDEAAQARAFLQRKRVSPPADERAAARVFRMLMRAGFAPRVIVPLLKGWKVSEETVEED